MSRVIRLPVTTEMAEKDTTIERLTAEVARLRDRLTLADEAAFRHQAEIDRLNEEIARLRGRTFTLTTSPIDSTGATIVVYPDNSWERIYE